MTIVGACSTAARTDGRVDQLTLMRGNIGGYEFNRMVVLFSMMDGPKEIPSAPLRWTIWNTSRGQRPTSANDNSCDFGIGSNNAHRGNSSPGSSRAILPASFCAVSIFANSFGQALCSKDSTRFCATKLIRRFARAAGRGARAGRLCRLRQPEENMIIARLLLIGLSLLTTSPVFATTELCRSIGADKERLACFDREASPVQASNRQAKAAEETTGSKFVDPVESFKTENDKVSARLKGICRGC